MKVMTLSEVNNSDSEWPFFIKGHLPRLFLTICHCKDIEPEFWIFDKGENEEEAVSALLEKDCYIFPIPAAIDKTTARDLAIQCHHLQDPEEITGFIVECIQSGFKIMTSES